MQGSTKDGYAALACKLRGAALGALLAVCVVCVAAPGAALAGTLDQQQTDASGGQDVILSGQSLAQTFTAGRSGGLDQVDLYLGKNNPSPTAPLIVEIRDISGSVPGNIVLASRSLPPSAVTAAFAGAWLSIGFAAPAPVAAGTRYAIVASSSEQASEYAWSGSPNPGAYAGGDPFGTADIPPSGGWFASTALGGDYAFKTYVVSDTTPPETMIGSKKIKSTKATFTFISSEPGSTFQCKLDKHSFKPCSSPKKYKHLSSGKHKFKVRAVDAAGNIDASPSKKKFTI